MVLADTGTFAREIERSSSASMGNHMSLSDGFKQSVEPNMSGGFLDMIADSQVPSTETNITAQPTGQDARKAETVIGQANTNTGWDPSAKLNNHDIAKGAPTHKNIASLKQETASEVKTNINQAREDLGLQQNNQTSNIQNGTMGAGRLATNAAIGSGATIAATIAGGPAIGAIVAKGAMASTVIDASRVFGAPFQSDIMVRPAKGSKSKSRDLEAQKEQKLASANDAVQRDMSQMQGAGKASISAEPNESDAKPDDPLAPEDIEQLEHELALAEGRVEQFEQDAEIALDMHEYREQGLQGLSFGQQSQAGRMSQVNTEMQSNLNMAAMLEETDPGLAEQVFKSQAHEMVVPGGPV